MYQKVGAIHILHSIGCNKWGGDFVGNNVGDNHVLG